MVAGCTPTGGCDYSLARDRYFYHQAGDIDEKSMAIESIKYPLLNTERGLQTTIHDLRAQYTVIGVSILDGPGWWDFLAVFGG